MGEEFKTESMHVCVLYTWNILLYTWNIFNQLYSNIKFKKSFIWSDRKSRRLPYTFHKK